ncbi:MAG: hypothetical protein DWI02_10730 [Planctomycetota bacterium]|nr:MAG: hypothetical protein DWI02_10730 [Planctomycetota bacterium]
MIPLQILENRNSTFSELEHFPVPKSIIRCVPSIRQPAHVSHLRAFPPCVSITRRRLPSETGSIQAEWGRPGFDTDILETLPENSGVPKTHLPKNGFIT